jgi:hypothetical protein
VRDGDVNTDGSGGGRSWGEEVYRNIQGPTAGEVWDLLGWFQLHIVFGLNKVGKWGQGVGGW